MADMYKNEFCEKFDIPLSHMDYGYVGKCNDVKQIEKILKALRSGEEGRFPDLEEFTERRLEKIHPKSRLLRKDKPVKTARDFSSEEWSQIEDDLKSWHSDIRTAESNLKQNDDSSIETTDTTLVPPVRGTANIINTNKISEEDDNTKKSTKKRVKPRDYNEWDKIDIDAELEKVDGKTSIKSENKGSLRKPAKPNIPSTIEASNLTDQQKIQKAEREKDKGNEAFRAQDYHEALVYYNRSLSLIPTVAAHNNRAQTYIKLNKWDEALSDCNAVLKAEPNNMKALLRRGVAFQGMSSWQYAKNDLEQVLKQEPSNKRAQEVLAAVEKSLEEKKKKGRRLVIEEIDGESEEEDKTNEKELGKGDQNKVKIQMIEKKEEESNKTTKNNTENSKQQQQPMSASAKKRNRKKKKNKEKESKTDDSKLNAAAKSAESQNTPESAPTKAPSSKQEVCNPASKAPSSKQEVCNSTSKAPSSKPEVSNSTSKAPSSKPEVSNSTSKAPSENKQEVSSPAALHVAPLAPLPVDVEKIKQQGNDMFKRGSYGEAKDLYSKAMTKLEKEGACQQHNMCLLLSNRANCHHKLGDLPSCAKDCNNALHINPTAIKPLVRRAQAYEAMERYRKSYEDYRQALYLEPTMDVAQQGVNRCMSHLRETDGPKWREKLPSITPLQRHPVFPSSSAAAVQQAPPAASCPPAAVQEAPPALSKEQEFNNHKEQGNKCVKNEDLRSAIDCYTKCIQVFPDRTVPYTNRALCYLRLNQADKVVKDCDSALQLEPHNVKALFRRAQAFKMQKEFSKSRSDLDALLKIDPKNAAAKRELSVVLNYITAEEKKLNSEKKRHRVKIEEVESTSSEDESIPETKCKPSSEKMNQSTPPSSVQINSKQHNQTQQKVRVDMSKSSPMEKQQKCDVENKSASPVSAASNDNSDDIVSSERPDSAVSDRGSAAERPDSAVSDRGSAAERPDSAVSDRGSAPKTTPYEFIQTWSTLRPSMGAEPYAKLMQQIEADDLVKVISNKLDGDMLSIIIKCVNIFINQGLASKALEYLQKLVCVPRFEMVTMFMSPTDKTELNSILDRLGEWGSCSYLDEDLKKLRKAYSL